MDPWHGFLYTVIDVQLIPFVFLIEAEYKISLLHLSAMFHSVQRKKYMLVSNSDTHLHMSYFPKSKQHHDSMWNIVNNVWLFPVIFVILKDQKAFLFRYTALYTVCLW